MQPSNAAPALKPQDPESDTAQTNRNNPLEESPRVRQSQPSSGLKGIAMPKKGPGQSAEILAMAQPEVEQEQGLAQSQPNIAPVKRDSQGRISAINYLNGRGVSDISYKGDSKVIESFQLKREDNDRVLNYQKIGNHLWQVSYQDEQGNTRISGNWRGYVSFSSEEKWASKPIDGEYWHIREEDGSVTKVKQTRDAKGTVLLTESLRPDNARTLRYADQTKLSYDSKGLLGSVQRSDGSRLDLSYDKGDLSRVEVSDKDGVKQETWTIDANSGKWKTASGTLREQVSSPVNDQGEYRYSRVNTEGEIDKILVQRDGRTVQTRVPNWDKELLRADEQGVVQVARDELGRIAGAAYPGGRLLENVKYAGDSNDIVELRIRPQKSEKTLVYSRQRNSQSWRYVEIDEAGNQSQPKRWQGDVSIDREGRVRTDSPNQKGYTRIRDVSGEVYRERKLDNQSIERVHSDGIRIVSHTDSSLTKHDKDGKLIHLSRPDQSQLDVRHVEGKITEVINTDKDGGKTTWTFNQEEELWTSSDPSLNPSKTPPVDNSGRYSYSRPSADDGLVIQHSLYVNGKHLETKTTKHLADARENLLQGLSENKDVTKEPEKLKEIKKSMTTFEERMLLRARKRDQNSQGNGPTPDESFTQEAERKIKETYDELAKILTSPEKTVFEKNPQGAVATESGDRWVRVGLFRRIRQRSQSRRMVKGSVSRLEAVQEYMYHAGAKGVDNVDQNPFPTCMMTTGEKFVYCEHPSRGARVLKDLLFTSSYQSHDGKKVNVPLGSLIPGRQEKSFDVDTGLDNSKRSRVSKMMENAFGTGYKQLAEGRPNAAYHSNHGWNSGEIKRVTEIVTGEKMPWEGDYRSNEQIAREFRSGNIAVLGASGARHGWTINALYSEGENGNVDVKIMKDNQWGERKDHKPTDVTAQNVAVARQVWGRSGRRNPRVRIFPRFRRR